MGAAASLPREGGQDENKPQACLLGHRGVYELRN